MLNEKNTWRAGFEIELALGDLDDPRFEDYLGDPMDLASPLYCQSLAALLRELTGRRWSAPRKAPRRIGFYVLPEYDLDPIHWPYGRIAGVELITPPLELAQAQAVREEICEAISSIDGDFNFLDSDTMESCAWHINIDAGNDRLLDISRFVVSNHEFSLLLQNGRYPNAYASPQTHAFGTSLLRLLREKPDFSLVGVNFKNFLTRNSAKGKRYAANFEKLSLGYLELRHFGTTAFFNGKPLSALLGPTIDAFEMSNEMETIFQKRLLERFSILSDWANELRPRISLEKRDDSGLVSMEFGRMLLDEELAATASWNGTLDLAVTGENGWSETAKIYDQQLPDAVDALALCAMDLADMQNLNYVKSSFASRMLGEAVEQLANSIQRFD